MQTRTQNHPRASRPLEVSWLDTRRPRPVFSSRSGMVARWSVLLAIATLTALAHPALADDGDTSNASPEAVQRAPQGDADPGDTAEPAPSKDAVLAETEGTDDDETEGTDDDEAAVDSEETDDADTSGEVTSANVVGTPTPTPPSTTEAAESSEDHQGEGSSTDVYHTPPASWQAGEQLVLNAVIGADWQRERTWVGLRAHADSVTTRGRFQAGCTRAGHTFNPQQGGFCEISILRADGNSYAAVVPAELMQPPGVEYYVASRTLEGAYLTHFASANRPYGVAVIGESAETERAERAARHHGHTSRFEVTSDVTVYGQTLQPEIAVRSGEEQLPVDRASDLFWVVSPSYAYRPLKTLYAFRFGVNIMRGTIPTVDDKEIDVDSFTPGMYSGFGEIDLELHRLFSVAGRVHLGATDEGFAVGFGALGRIGPRYATHLELGLDGIMRIGFKYWMRFGWTTVPRFPMALTIEATEYPQTQYKIRNPNDPNDAPWDVERALGLRLMLDVGFDINDAITVGLRGGYATRLESIEPGFVAGLNASLEF